MKLPRYILLQKQFQQFGVVQNFNEFLTLFQVQPTSYLGFHRNLDQGLPKFNKFLTDGEIVSTISLTSKNIKFCFS